MLGTRQTYTLNQPLKIRKGEFLALTIPTWAPSFAVNLGSNTNVWRSSRDAGKCSGTDNIKAGKPQQKVGSARPTAATTRPHGSSTGATYGPAERRSAAPGGVHQHRKATSLPIFGSETTLGG